MSWYPRVYTNTVDFDVSGDLTLGDDFTLGGDVVLDRSSANVLRLASGDTLSVTDADKLLVNSVIVPTILYANVQYSPLATITEYDLMIAKRAITVVSIDVVPSTLQGGALTGTIVKATGTATPAFGTTPMHTANAINFNSGAYTVQSITLTATAADLTLAAGERIGLDLSAAMTAGKGVITIGYKFA